MNKMIVCLSLLLITFQQKSQAISNANTLSLAVQNTMRIVALVQTDTFATIADSVFGQCQQLNGPTGNIRFDFDVIGENLYTRIRKDIFQSSDYGATWVKISSAIPENLFQEKDITIGKLQFRIGENSVDSCTNHFHYSILRRMDGDKFWTPVNSGLPIDCEHAVSALTFFRGKMYAALMYVPDDMEPSNGGLFYSSDSGKSWKTTKLEFESGSNNFIKSFIATKKHLFACLNSSGVYSTADGVNWIEDTSGLPSVVISNKVQIGNLSIVLGKQENTKLFYTSDEGEKWIELDKNHPFNSVSVLLYTIGTILFVYENGPQQVKHGALFSSDSGKSWKSINKRLPRSDLYINYTSHSPKNLFTITWDNYIGNIKKKVFRSSDSGAHWSEVVADSFDRSITFFKAMNGIIISNIRDKGLIRSADDGNNWTNVLKLQHEVYYTLISDTLFATDHKGIVFRSEDKAKSWTQVNKRSVGRVTGFTSMGKSLYADILVGSDSTSIIRSENGGSSWRKIDSVLPVFYYKDESGGSLLNFSIKAVGKYLFALSDSGNYVYSDSSNDWRAVRSGIFKYGIKSVAENGTHLFMANDKGLFMSKDSGTSWRKIRTNIPADSKIVSLDATDTDIIINTGFTLWRLSYLEIK